MIVRRPPRPYDSPRNITLRRRPIKGYTVIITCYSIACRYRIVDDDSIVCIPDTDTLSRRERTGRRNRIIDHPGVRSSGR